MVSSPAPASIVEFLPPVLFVIESLPPSAFIVTLLPVLVIMSSPSVPVTKLLFTVLLIVIDNDFSLPLI